MNLTLPATCHEEPFPRAGDRHVKEPPFLLHVAVVLIHTALVRENALLNSGKKYDVVLQAFGGVDRHEMHVPEVVLLIQFIANLQTDPVQIALQ